MRSYTLTIGTLRDRYKYRQMELNPPYQRRSVWKTKQRVLLLSSIFNGIPIPALIFHKHYDGKRSRDIYDVLDGKQRIETILHFIELLDVDSDKEWEVKIRKNPEETLVFTYSDLKSKKFNKEHNNIADRFWNYEVPVIEYEGELIDFFGNPVPTMEVFVRINSTGSALKKNEIRHASHNLPFFKLAGELENTFLKRFKDNWQIFSENEIQRYTLHEFILELCTALYFQKYTDRRKKLDELLISHSWKPAEIQAMRLRFAQIVKWMRSIFTDEVFVNTRFNNKSDFYSLFIVLSDLLAKKYVTTEKRDNQILGNTLLEFSKAAQEISFELKTYDIDKSWKGHDKEMIQYVIATRSATDTLRNRQFRHDFLHKLLRGFILKKKDEKRIFDENAKGALWTRLLQRYKTPKCPNPKKNPNCKKFLVYEDAQIDHVYPWSKGGPTTLKNAQLICSSCNKNKGNK